jgi:methionyl-tRNA synthetase
MYYITTPLPYVNAEPHLGHLLEHIVTDTIRRYRQRVESQEVFLEYGVDQHGLKIWQKAQELNKDPAVFVKEQAQQYRELWQKYNCQADTFIETDSENHKILSQIVYRELLKKDFIYKKSYKGLYCVGCEDFYAPSQLNEKGECPIHHTKPIEMNEENYFFRLSAFEDEVKEFLQKANIKPNSSRTEWLNFVSEGLQDMSMSRETARMPWGIAIPGDETQVMYVWFEAVLNYWTAIVNPETFDRYRELPLERSQIEKEMLAEIKRNLPIDCMYLGKDIAKFHLVVFVAMFCAMKLEDKLPQNALVHGMINDTQGRKFSKSLGNGVLPQELETKFGIDGTRYIILSQINTFGDTNFDWTRVTEAYNAALANNLGNAVMRVSTLLEKHFAEFDLFDFEENTMIKDQSLDVDLRQVYKLLEEFDCQSAINELFIQAAKLNVYLEETKPWSLAKDMETNKDKVLQILGQAAVYLVEIGKCLSIFLPESGARIVEIFESEKIKKAEVLFPKVELEKAN